MRGDRIWTFEYFTRASLRRNLVLIVTLGVVIPVAFVAAWTTKRLERAGHELLRDQIETSLTAIDRVISQNWAVRRGDLMLLAENDVVRRVLSTPGLSISAGEARFLQDAYARLADAVESAVIYNNDGNAVLRVASDPALDVQTEARPSGDTRPVSRLGVLAVTIPVTDEGTGERLGSMTALVTLTSMLPVRPLPAVPGAVFRLIDSELNIPLLIQNGAAQSLTTASTNDPAPLVVRHTLASPALVLEMVAPAAPYVTPFARSARESILLLLGIMLVAATAAAMLTARATTSLNKLSHAAAAVARGDLEHQVEVHSRDEIGQVADAFNSMTVDLRRSLRELAQRKALAAVGEFAAELAHEIRNPLTSIRLDLQRIGERLPPENNLHEPLARALSGVERLNRTVTGSLRLARSGTVVLEPLQLRAPLDAAIHAAGPAFATRGVGLERRTTEVDDCRLLGDDSALTQLFTNILLNAAEATDHSGNVVVSTGHNNGLVTVTVSDTGPGMSPEVLERLDEPFHTTKRGGTGLGLTIARRIAAAHGGKVTFESRPGNGTSVRISLPKDQTEATLQ